jgi:oligoendopeptidase F
MTTKKIPARDELPEQVRWDLTTMYTSDEAWENDLAAIDGKVPQLQVLKGKLADSPSMLLRCLEAEDDISRFIDKIHTYAALKSDEDKANSKYQAMLDRVTSIVHEISAELAWIQPEIMAIDEATMKRFLESKELAFYKIALVNILRYKPHTLSESEERILALASENAQVPYKVFSMLTSADIRFPEVPDGEGGNVELTHGVYSKLMEDKDRDVRKKAFFGMYETFGNFKNTLATTLNGSVKAHIINAKIRKFPSALDASLFHDVVKKEVYENLVDAINKNLGIFHKYISLRKRITGIEDLEMYDVYVPIVKDFSITVPYEQARTWVLESVKPLGSEYAGIVKKALDERWIDTLECRGKRSGAYSSGCYDSNPYILMNYNDTLDSVFTLAHELGHSLHSWFSRQSQKYRYSGYSIFVAEVASTTNELLLTDYLLKLTDDPKFRLYLLNHLCDAFKGTVYRQVQFAEFEKLIYEKVEQNIPLTVDVLNEMYYSINRKYYGPQLENADKIIEREWSRIPHFYYNFYVYKYATGFSAAVVLSNNILSGDKAKVDKYLGFLKAGNSQDPLDVLRGAGVDLSSREVIESALVKFDKTIETFTAELDKLNAGTATH